MASYVASWAFRCPRCRNWRSNLDVRINEEVARPIDETQRGVALHRLREENNKQILDVIGATRSPGNARLLDVGSAHGWFLAAATDAGLDAQGIEPDTEIAAQALRAGATVRVGYFPGAVPPEEVFDIITFNDVLEHLPDVHAALDACANRLAPDGLLAINIPNASGIVFRLSTLLGRLGIDASFARLWQRGMPSPHLWYFTPQGLSTVVERHGFTRVMQTSLKSITRAGLWERIHFDRRPSVVSVAAFAALWTSASVLNMKRASDVMLLVFRRQA